LFAFASKLFLQNPSSVTTQIPVVEMISQPFSLDEIPQFLLSGCEALINIGRAVIRLNEVQVGLALLLINLVHQPVSAMVQP